MAITTELKGLLTVKIKSRHDSYSDQFNRIFVVKILLTCSVVMGISWYKDSINCINSTKISSSFVSSTCWIQGIYVYTELKDRFDEVSYYGVPKDIDMDGIMPNKELCGTENRLDHRKVSPHCKALTKTFFLQYQWMPFYIGVLALCFYIPYFLHLYGNNDMISLKGTLKRGDKNAETIINTYFNRKTNPTIHHWLRISFNYFIKVMYIAVNLVAFYGTDALLLGKFQDYGTKWVKWSRLENHIAYDYMGMKNYPRPGNELLPPFGYCEFYESSREAIRSIGNRHKLLCELSQNILYQYCFILIWFTLIFGMIISTIGFLALIVDHIVTFICAFTYGSVAKKMYGKLTLRECEYLEFIRRRDLPFYAEVLQKLKEDKLGIRFRNGNTNDSLPCESPPPGFEEATKCNTRL